jgi:hypothetical protein
VSVINVGVLASRDVAAERLVNPLWCVIEVKNHLPLLAGSRSVDAIRWRILMQRGNAVLLTFGSTDSSGFLGHLICDCGIIPPPPPASMRITRETGVFAIRSHMTMRLLSKPRQSIL